jgi:hypothetical protein
VLPAATPRRLIRGPDGRPSMIVDCPVCRKELVADAFASDVACPECGVTSRIVLQDVLHGDPAEQ